MIMEKRSFLGNWIAALLCAVMWLVMPSAAQAQTISNTAAASWTSGGQGFSALSNTVAFAVETNTVRLETFVPVSGAGQPLSFTPAQCGGASIALPGGSGQFVPATGLRAGQGLYLKLTDNAANRDPAAIDTVTAILTTLNGDREEVTVFETAPNSGLFVGAVPTTLVPISPVDGDCRLSVRAGEQVSIRFAQSGAILPDIAGAMSVLADPYGIAFDSEDGTPVSGVRISPLDRIRSRTPRRR